MEQQEGRDAELRGERGARSEGDRRRHEPPQPLSDRRRQRHHPGVAATDELESDRPDEPRVEDQEHEDRRGQDRAGRARPARSARLRARSWPSRRRASPTARHRSSRRRTRPCRRQDRTAASGSSEGSEASPRIGASTMATFSPDTTSRWPSPLAWKSRIMPASSCECVAQRQPEEQPGLLRAGTSRAIDRPTNARNTCAARMNGLGDGPTRSTASPFSSTAIPLWASASRNPGSSGRRITPSARDDVPAHPPRRVVVGAQPQGCARATRRAPGHSTRVTSSVGVPPERTGLGIGVQRADRP